MGHLSNCERLSSENLIAIKVFIPESLMYSGFLGMCLTCCVTGITAASWTYLCAMLVGLQYYITSHLRAAGRWFHHSNSTSLQVLVALGVVFDFNPTHLPFSLPLTQTTQCSFVSREKGWRDSPTAHECDITRLWCATTSFRNFKWSRVCGGDGKQFWR